MKKLLMVVLALAVIGGMALAARADAVGFELGTMYYNSNENTAKNGTGSFLAVTIPVDSMTSVGFYREGLGFTLQDDKLAAALPTTVNIEMAIEALQATREVAKGFYAGLHLGMADMTAYLAGAVQWTDTVPMGDVYIKWNILTGGEKIKTELNATIGYRTLFITPVIPDAIAPAGDFVKPVDDLGGMWFAISFGLNF